MKIAKVIPIYRTGAKDGFNFNRPISLLPQFSNILDELFDDRFSKFICLIISYQTANLLSELTGLLE